MSTLMEHLMLERDIDVPMVEVPGLGVVVVEDGDQMDGEHVRSSTWACHCDDGLHRDIDREELEYPDSRLPFHAHRVPVHIYAVVGPVIEEKDA